MALMAMKDVTIAFEGTVAVDRVSFEVNRGDYLVIVGENGSGKSTLIRAMLGLVKPRSGRVSKGNLCPLAGGAGGSATRKTGCDKQLTPLKNKKAKPAKGGEAAASDAAAAPRGRSPMRERKPATGNRKDNADSHAAKRAKVKNGAGRSE